MQTIGWRVATLRGIAEAMPRTTGSSGHHDHHHHEHGVAPPAGGATDRFAPCPLRIGESRAASEIEPLDGDLKSDSGLGEQFV
jgi:hypothetical protein